MQEEAKVALDASPETRVVRTGLEIQGNARVTKKDSFQIRRI
jgi:hypothetical protein